MTAENEFLFTFIGSQDGYKGLKGTLSYNDDNQPKLTTVDLDWVAAT